MEHKSKDIMEKEMNIEIVGLASTGKGIATIKENSFSLPVFIDYSCPGDTLLVQITKNEKKYYEADIKEIIHKSPFRIEAPCKHYQICGACNLLHISYEKQLEEKKKILLFLFQRNNIPLPEITMIPCKKEYNYRDKARFSLRIEKGKGCCGFMKRRSKELIKIEECFIVNKKILQLIHLFNAMEFDPSITAQVEITASEDMIDGKLVLFAETTSLSYLLSNAIEQLLEKHKELIKGLNMKIKDKTKRTGDYICRYKYKDIEYHFLPETFTQGNFSLNNQLIDTVLSYCGKGKNLLELYAGFGNFSLALAKQFEKVVAVEGEFKCVHFGNENRERNNLKNVFFVNKDVNHYFKGKIDDYDCVLLDPPRDGCKPTLLQKINIVTNTVVYVSCNAATLITDVKQFVRNGFAITEICLIDMFAQTNYFEVVIKMERRKENEEEKEEVKD